LARNLSNEKVLKIEILLGILSEKKESFVKRID